MCAIRPVFLFFLIDVTCRLPSISKPAVCTCLCAFELSKVICVLNVNHYNLIKIAIDFCLPNLAQHSSPGLRKKSGEAVSF